MNKCLFFSRFFKLGSYIISSLLLFSCTQALVKEEHKDRFVVSYKIKILEDDSFELYFNSKEINSFLPLKLRKQKINKSDSFQLVEFVLGIDDYPTRLRFDFGVNKNQKPIIIKEIKISYNGNEHQFSKEEVQNFFKPNKYIDFDFNDLIIKTKEIEGKYDPYIETFNLSKFFNKLMLY